MFCSHEPNSFGCYVISAACLFLVAPLCNIRYIDYVVHATQCLIECLDNGQFARNKSKSETYFIVRLMTTAGYDKYEFTDTTAGHANGALVNWLHNTIFRIMILAGCLKSNSSPRYIYTPHLWWWFCALNGFMCLVGTHADALNRMHLNKRMRAQPGYKRTHTHGTSHIERGMERQIVCRWW